LLKSGGLPHRKRGTKALFASSGLERQEIAKHWQFMAGLGGLELMTGQAILTPMLMVIIMITGDFLPISLATDRVRTYEVPNSWEIGKITGAGLLLGFCFLPFCTGGILAVGKFEMHYGMDTLRTLTAIVLVYGSQAITCAVRGRRHLSGLRPRKWLVLTTCADVLFISVLANRGIAMAPLPLTVLATILEASVMFWMVLNIVKIPTFRILRLS
jgi:H+-transporting ATPase